MKKGVKVTKDLLHRDIAIKETKTDKKIDVAEALKLRLYNLLSWEEIAKRFSVSSATIRYHLEPFLKFLDHPPQIYQAYQKFESALLQLAKVKILEYMLNPSVLEKATINNLAYAFSQLDHAYRLSSGQSTENVDVRSLQMSLHELKKQRAQLEAELKLITKQIPNEDSDK